MLRDLLGFSKDPLELEISEAAETFREHKDRDMESANQKAEDIRSDVIQEVEDLEESLEELGEFEDEKDRQVINDVVDNIVSDRLEMIEELEFSEDPEELYSELNQFITDFQSLKQKEAAVLEEAYLQKKISRTIGGLESQTERLGEFLDSEYSIVTNYEELENLLDKREDLLDEVDSLEEEIEQLEVEKLETEIDEIEEELSELKNSSDWDDYEFLQDEVQQKKSEKKQIKSDINTSLNKMERGLKKLIYQAQNGDLSVGKVSVLEKLRDKKTNHILDHPDKTVEAVKDAKESLPDDLLNDRQQKKFLESINEVEDLPQKSDRIENLESEVKELEQQIEDHSVLKQKSKLESEKKSLDKKLSEERDEKYNLEKKVNETRSEVEETEERIQEVMEDSFDREININ